VAVVAPPLIYPVPQFLIVVEFAFRQAGSPRIGVSSWLRTDTKALELAEQGRGVGLRSLHNRGLALDLVGPAPSLGAFAEAWQRLGLDALFEPDHLHIELDGPALRSLGVDFRI